MSRILASLISLLKIACVLMFFGVLFIVSGYAAVQWALSAEEFEVPDVLGRPLTEAHRILEERGLIVELDDRPLTDEEVPEGSVLRQNPPAGTAIKRQRGIRLTLSSGPPRRALPLTVGNALQQSQIALEQKGVQVESVSRVYSWEFDRDRVIAQQPEGTDLPEGSQVKARLLVSLGAPPRTWVMPDLLYRNIDDVRQYLERQGLRVQTRPSRRRNEGQPPGTILDQTPVNGFKIAQGDVITLTINPS